MPRKKPSKKPAPITEKTRAEDERLRRELEHADPEKFKRFMKPLFGVSKKKEAAGVDEEKGKA